MTDAVHEFLNKPMRIRSRLRRIIAEINSLRYSMGIQAIRYDADRVQSSPDDPMARYAVELEKLETKERETRNELLKANDAIIKASKQLTDDEATIIIDHFLSDKRFEKIAEDMKYSRRSLFYKYHEAVRKINDLIKK